jgi:hypothetical protein
MKPYKATLTREWIVLSRSNKDKRETEIESFEVVVMATSGIYAMVRRKGCMPFVCEVKQLTKSEVKNDTKDY